MRREHMTHTTEDWQSYCKYTSGSADPRLLGALRKTGSGGGENEWNAFVRVSLCLESRLV